MTTPKLNKFPNIPFSDDMDLLALVESDMEVTTNPTKNIIEESQNEKIAK